MEIKKREMGRIMTRKASGTARKQRRKAMSLWLLHVFGSLDLTRGDMIAKARNYEAKAKGIFQLIT